MIPEAFQAPWELDQLVAIYKRLKPKRVLEIGAMYGGTLFHWLQSPGTTVVVIDDEMRRAEEWAQWAERFGSNLILLHGRSQDSGIVAMARQYGQFGFIFIDGDHTYDAVRADWDNYSPMLTSDGVVVLHDIIARPGYGVSQVWHEMRGGRRSIAICQDETLPGNEGPCGIGLIWP